MTAAEPHGMSLNLETLAQQIGAILGERVVELKNALGELTLTVRAADYLEVATTLRDHPELKLEQLIDLCGVDYSDFGNGGYEGQRSAGLRSRRCRSRCSQRRTGRSTARA